jgi:hypothetical protein
VAECRFQAARTEAEVAELEVFLLLPVAGAVVTDVLASMVPLRTPSQRIPSLMV